MTRFSRRQMLTVTGAVAGAVAVGVPGTVTPAVAAPATTGPASNGQKDRDWPGAASANGWPIVGPDAVTTYRIEGSDASVALLPGAVATVLLHVARRVNYELGLLEPAAVEGHRTDRRLRAAFESNHLSGTALAIRPGAYPVGSAGNLFPHELSIVRDILGECDGVVRWGGDDPEYPAEGHFQIDVRPGDRRLTLLAERITGWRARPGRGAGVAPDPLDPTRRATARALERRQRPA
jgi:hypothetical protein